MTYLHTPTSAYPVSETDIRTLFPNTSFPQPFSPPEGYVPVFRAPPPDHNAITETVREIAPVLTNKGHYEQAWEIVPRYATQEEADAAVAADLALRKERIWGQIKAVRDLKTQTGGFPAAGKWFHSDTFSRTQHMGLVMMGANLPPVPWKTMDGTFITLTPSIVQEIFQNGASQDVAIFSNAESLRAQVFASNNPESVDITAGWPASYQP